jgi:HK97 family phage prohead protease
MEHLTLKAATAVQTDEGTFTAVISTVAVDRHKDIVDPDGLVRALHKWVSVGKNIPLAWHHSTRPEDIIGHIDPSSARNDGGKVVVEGWIDQDVDPAGKHAWRLVKSGTLGFSYGYIPLDQKPRKGGGFHIKEADVFEVTATPIPANHETQVVGWKSLDELKATAVQVAREVEEHQIPAELPPVEVPAPVDPEFETLKSQFGELRKELEDLKAKQTEITPAELKSKADRVALEVEQTAIPDTLPEVEVIPPQEQEESELQKVKAELAEIRQALEDLKQKQADETDKATQSRSVDPLRQQADAVALEVATGTVSLPPTKQVAASPVPELSLGDLRKKMRDEMLGVLSGGITGSE